MKRICDHYCTHGGCCMLPKYHRRKHNSGFCVWDSKDSLKEEEANKLFIEKNGDVAKSIIRMTDLLKKIEIFARGMDNDNSKT